MKNPRSHVGKQVLFKFNFGRDIGIDPIDMIVAGQIIQWNERPNTPGGGFFEIFCPWRQVFRVPPDYVIGEYLISPNCIGLLE